jgi:hypothetical protein
MARAIVALGLLCVGLHGCAPAPQRTADRFVDYYFVEIDQARARTLASGLAARKLDDELALVRDIRKTYSPEDARPTIYWERRGLTVDGDHARASYEVRVQRGRDETRRAVMLTLERVGGAWTVSNYGVGEPPAASGTRP